MPRTLTTSGPPSPSPGCSRIPGIRHSQECGISNPAFLRMRLRSCRTRYDHSTTPPFHPRSSIFKPRSCMGGGGAVGCHAGAVGRISTTHNSQMGYDENNSSHHFTRWDESVFLCKHLARMLTGRGKSLTGGNRENKEENRGFRLRLLCFHLFCLLS